MVLTWCSVSPGSVPSTRPGVGLSALSERRRSPGDRLFFSEDSVALGASPSIAATGDDTHLVDRRQQERRQQGLRLGWT